MDIIDVTEPELAALLWPTLIDASVLDPAVTHRVCSSIRERPRIEDVRLCACTASAASSKYCRHKLLIVTRPPRSRPRFRLPSSVCALMRAHARMRVFMRTHARMRVFGAVSMRILCEHGTVCPHSGTCAARASVTPVTEQRQHSTGTRLRERKLAASTSVVSEMVSGTASRDGYVEQRLYPKFAIEIRQPFAGNASPSEFRRQHPSL